MFLIDFKVHSIMVVSENYFCCGVFIDREELLHLLKGHISDDMFQQVKKLYDDGIGKVRKEYEQGIITKKEFKNFLFDVQCDFDHEVKYFFSKNSSALLNLRIIPTQHDVVEGNEDDFVDVDLFLGVVMMIYDEQKRSGYTCSTEEIVKAINRFNDDLKWIGDMTIKVPQVYRLADDCDCCS